MGRSYAEGKKISWRHGFFALWTLLKYRFLHDPLVPSAVDLDRGAGDIAAPFGGEKRREGGELRRFSPAAKSPSSANRSAEKFLIDIVPILFYGPADFVTGVFMKTNAMLRRVYLNRNPLRRGLLLCLALLGMGPSPSPIAFRRL
jgi:hypothetical protein